MKTTHTPAALPRRTNSALLTSALAMLLFSQPVWGNEEAWGQETWDKAPSFEASLPQQAFEPESDTEYFTIAFENDSLGDGDDRHYTSGFRATWLSLGKPPSRFARGLMDIFGKSNDDAPIATYWSIGQNLYTPSDITKITPDPDERPYAAFLYASRGFTRAVDNRVDSIELTVGLVGPWALGEEVQSTVHEWIDSEEPQGWDNQLDNELGVSVAWERQWPTALTADIGPLYSRWMPHVGVTLGNVYTHAAAGVTWQIVPKSYGWKSPPLRVRPAIPGSGFFYPSEDSQFGWSAFIGMEARAVGRNIFLDGNTFRDSASVDSKLLVYDISAGFSLSFKKTRIDYTLNWRSDEFSGQNEEQLFGALSLSRRF
jgi:hypothetical protein